MFARSAKNGRAARWSAAALVLCLALPGAAPGEENAATTGRETPERHVDAAAVAAKAAMELAKNRRAWEAVARDFKRCRRSSRVDVRLAAMRLLRGIDHPDPADYLCGHVLEDRAEAVARAAAESLGGMRCDPAVEVALGHLRRAAGSKRVREERLALLAEAVAGMRNPRVIEALVGLLRERRKHLKLVGLLGLLHFQRLPPELAEEVLPLLEEGRKLDDYTRFVAVQALARIPAPAVIPALVRAARDDGMAGLAARMLLADLSGEGAAAAKRTPAGWRTWYEEARKHGTLPRPRAGAKLAPEATTTRGDADQGGCAGKNGADVKTGKGDQHTRYSSMLARSLREGAAPAWDTSGPKGKRSRYTFRTAPPPVIRLGIPDLGPRIHKPDEAEEMLETIRLYNGYRVTPATPTQWRELLRKMRENGLDVVLAIDSTGSMVPYLEQAKSALGASMRRLKQMVPKTRLGVCTYRDRPLVFRGHTYTEKYVVKGQRLGKNLNAALSFLHGIRAEGGGDYPEAVDEAVRWSTQEAGFRPGACKVVVLVGDAPPHREYVARALRLAREFRQARQGRLNTIHSNRREEVPELTALARAGGGQAYILNNRQALVRGILILIFGQEYAKYVERSF